MDDNLHVPELKDDNGNVDNVVQVSVENPIGTAMPEDELDVMRVVLSLNRNLGAVVEHSLPVDLSLLEAVITVEAHTATATTSPTTTATTAEIVATDATLYWQLKLMAPWLVSSPGQKLSQLEILTQCSLTRLLLARLLVRR
jgi:hypothetical protein